MRIIAETPRITGAVLVSVLEPPYLSGPAPGLLPRRYAVGLWAHAMFAANIGGVSSALRSAACSSPPHGCAPGRSSWPRPSTLDLACMFLFCWSHDDKYRFTRVAVRRGCCTPMPIAPWIFPFTSNCCSSVRRRLDTWPGFLRYAPWQTQIWPKVSPFKKSVEGMPPACRQRGCGGLLASHSRC